MFALMCCTSLIFLLTNIKTWSVCNLLMNLLAKRQSRFLDLNTDELLQTCELRHSSIVLFGLLDAFFGIKNMFSWI
jgi:hypothetical protein